MSRRSLPVEAAAREAHRDLRQRHPRLSLLRDNVLDELRLLVHPIVVGSGKRLFEDVSGPLGLTLVDAKTFSTGVLYLTYAPASE